MFINLCKISRLKRNNKKKNSNLFEYFVENDKIES